MPCTEGEKPEKREKDLQEAEAKEKKKRKTRRAPRFSAKQWLQHPAAAQLDDTSEEVFEERGREEKVLESQPFLSAGLPIGTFPEVEPRTSFVFSSGFPMMALAGRDGQITTTAADKPSLMMLGHIQMKKKGKAERMREKKRRKRETKSETRHQAELYLIKQDRIWSGVSFKRPGWLHEETRGFGNQVMPRVDPFQFRSVRQSDQYIAPRGGEDPERTAVLEGRRRRKEARRERKRGAESRAVRRVAEGVGITEQLRDAPANFSPKQVQVGEDRAIESETSGPASSAYLFAQRVSDSDAVGRERSGMLLTDSTLSQVQFNDDNLCCPRPEMVQGSEEERNVVKEIGVGEGGVEKKGGMSKPAELLVNSINVQS
uniref:Uncharacterized protein n=1 Tax=Chromera velia CCMP2878 TaxID=1169474 RepID=A0A0G4HCE5_9ALVE|eukprot:Cvel_6254.t1-p1 / transcript=Cvel_6254.t1 / gene=Cvel_6254 / organism=Chromera_velia_CCMP2878 / gene_product=hypothetical protein / transcript_product=hypothetical protein / location=Cvel_scaffold303:9233-10348(-) / protein_length=372 / sequence_SO=supercontig / SO=protein_coding / is_pseudo=false